MTPTTPATPRASETTIDRRDKVDSFGRTLVAMYRYRELLRNLVLRDLKLKYRGSVLGFLWSLLNPLLMIVVYTVAFKYILKSAIEDFVFYVMLGVLAWTFFVNSVMMSAGAIVDNAGLLKSVFFPRAILPVASVLFNFAQYLLTLLAFLPLMLVMYHRSPSPRWLLFPVFLALQLLFTIGLSLFLSTSTAFYRDVRHLLEILLAALFWLTPIVYQIQNMSPGIRSVILMGPMTPFIVAYQKIFFYHEWPDARVWLVAVAYTTVALVGGIAMMLAQEEKFSEQL